MRYERAGRLTLDPLDLLQKDQVQSPPTIPFSSGACSLYCWRPPPGSQVGEAA